MKGYIGLKILIVDSAPSTTRAQLVKHGGRGHADVYVAALRSQLPDDLRGMDFILVHAGDGGGLPPGLAMDDCGGIAWTGSPLSAYDDDPIVRHQIAFARAAFQSGVPCFGSCWGLQVMAVALGGQVRRHVEGLEFGVGRQITLHEAGRAHPMYAGKPAVFDAFSVHQDEVCVLPPGARLLAGNDHSVVQAAEIVDGVRSFWGVQYHPEYDLVQIAALLDREATSLASVGFAATPGDIEQMAADFRMLHRDPARKDVIWRYGLSKDVLDPARHRKELANWLITKVRPRVLGPRFVN